MATAKHFIGDGGTFKGIDKGDTRINESGLKKYPWSALLCCH